MPNCILPDIRRRGYRHTRTRPHNIAGVTNAACRDLPDIHGGGRVVVSIVKEMARHRLRIGFDVTRHSNHTWLTKSQLQVRRSRKNIAYDAHHPMFALFEERLKHSAAKSTASSRMQNPRKQRLRWRAGDVHPQVRCLRWRAANVPPMVRRLRWQAGNVNYAYVGGQET